MTRELRDREHSNERFTRRNVLRTAAGLGSTLAGVGALGTTRTRAARTINVVSEGADRTGETPVDDVLDSAVAANTRLLFPPGTYRLEGFSAEGLENVSFVGRNATLVPPEGSTGNLLALSGRNVTVRGFTFDYTAPSTAPMISMQCTDGLELRDCEFVGQADVPGGGGSSGHQYHLLPAVTDPNGSGLVKNVTMADGTTSPSNRGAIWFGQSNKGKLVFDGLHVEQFANNSLYCYTSAGPVVVKNSFFRNNNVSGPRIGSNGTRILNTTVVSDGEVPVQGFTGGQTSRGIWIPADCSDVLVRGCDFVMSGPHASSGILYDAPNAGADVKNCRFEMDVDRPAIDASVSAAPITIEDVSVTGDAASEAAINVNGSATVSDVCIQGQGKGNSCASAKSVPPHANGNPGGNRGNGNGNGGNGNGRGNGRGRSNGNRGGR